MKPEILSFVAFVMLCIKCFLFFRSSRVKGRKAMEVP
jgi:hypothetical protein